MRFPPGKYFFVFEGKSCQMTLMPTLGILKLVFMLLPRTLCMGVRITVVLDQSNVEKLRSLQAKMIKSTSKSVSFSSVLNQVAEEGLKKFKA